MRKLSKEAKGATDINIEQKQLEQLTNGMVRNIVYLTNSLNDKASFSGKEVKYWIFTLQDFMRISIAYGDNKLVNYWFPMKNLYLYDSEYTIVKEIIRAIYVLLENNPMQMADRRTETRTID